MGNGVGEADDIPTFYFSINLIFSISYLPNFLPPNLRLPRLPCETFVAVVSPG